MQKHRSWQGASETEWQEACRRESAIRSLIESGPVGHARADVVAKDLGISGALVYRLVSRYRLRAQTPSLLPSRRGRAPRSRLLDPAVLPIPRSSLRGSEGFVFVCHLVSRTPCGAPRGVDSARHALARPAGRAGCASSETIKGFSSTN